MNEIRKFIHYTNKDIKNLRKLIKKWVSVQFVRTLHYRKK